jgi:hypothetical protein
MSSIQEVRVAEKKVQAVLRELKQTDLTSRDDLHQQLAEATDEYVKAIADLEINSLDANCRKHA